jgi:excisionase family DNA binding protein
MEQLQKLFSLAEVAQLLNLSPHTIRSLVRKGKLHPVPICRRLRFDPVEVAALMKA